jgi:uncharacterized protein YndB with AHSA1/START domain
MSVTSVRRDLENLTLSLIADFDAPIEQVWQLWADPRQLERWWGPPTHPATFEEHDLSPGGTATYFMTGPDGQTYRGWWRVTSVEPPTSLAFTDGFADADGTPSAGMPTTAVTMRLTQHGDGTRMELRSVYDSREDMERVVEMGVEEGLRLAVGQMDALLPHGPELARKETT